MNKTIFKSAIVLYFIIAFEVLIMISPFAGFFYSIFNPVLLEAARYPATRWLSAFYLPHMVLPQDWFLKFLRIMGSVLFVVGGAFGYFVAFPYALLFLIGVGTNLGFEAMISASEYFDLFLMVMLVLGLVFEIPAVIFILSRIGLVTAGFLWRNIRYAILLCAIIAAVITPTSDIPNMMIVAVPMMALYMLGILVALVFGKKRVKTDN